MKSPFKILGYACLYLDAKLFRSSAEREFTRWFADHGDQTHRLNYDLNEDSLVIDLGGYHGQWASDVYGRFNCTVHVFEPVTRFHDYIKWRFERNDKIVVHKLGLGGKRQKVELAILGDRSSVVNIASNKSDVVEVVIEPASEYLGSFCKRDIDLMKINIEGAEYELLEHLIASGWVNKIKNIQVQFHDFVPNAVARRDFIRESLSKTHNVCFDYPFVWEGWTRKDIAQPAVCKL